MGEVSRAARLQRSSVGALFGSSDRARNLTLTHRERRGSSTRDSVSGGFGGGVHAVLGDFVEAAGGRLDLVAIKMVERDSTFADGVTLLDGFGYVGLGESGGLEKRTS